MNTPKLIMRTIDAVEAAQADIRSGSPDLMLHGFAMMISILTEQGERFSELYPEDRRMRAFVASQVSELKKYHAQVIQVMERLDKAEIRRVQQEQAAREDARQGKLF